MLHECGGSEEHCVRETSGYYHRRVTTVEFFIDLPRKTWKWLKGRESYLGLPRWISVWLGLSAAGTFFSSMMNYYDMSLYMSGTFIVAGVIYLYLCFTRR